MDLPEGLSKAEAQEKINVVSDQLAAQEDVANVLPGQLTDDRATGMEWNRSKIPLCRSVNSRTAV